MDRLDLSVKLDLPKSTHQLVPKTVRVKLPPLVISAQPNAEEQVGGLLWLDRFDERFSLRDDAMIPGADSFTDNNNDETLLLFGITCESMECPWFRPMMDLFLNSAAYGTNMIHVTVEGQGSFMEILLGRQHNFYVNTGQEYLYDSRRQHRHLLSSSSTTKEQAQANCLHLDDDSGDFDFSLCWLLEPSDGFVLVGSMSLFDFVMDGFTEVAWKTGGDVFQMDMNAWVEMGDNSEIMDMNGVMSIDWQDDLVIGFTATNEGTWSPFMADMFWDGSTVDDVFTMTLNKANIIVDGDEILKAATGSLVWDFDAQSLNANVQDTKLQASFMGALVGDSKLESTSKIVRNGKTHLETSLEGQVFASDFDVGNFLATFEETTTGFAISATGTLDRNQRSLEAQLLSDFLTISVNGIVDELDEAFRGGFGMGWDGQDLFNTRWEGRLVPTVDDSVKVTMTFEETISEFSMEGGVTVSSIGDIITFLVDTFVFQLKQTRHVDMTAKVEIDTDASTVAVHVEDVGQLDFVGDMSGTWCTECSSNILIEITDGVASRGPEILFGISSAVFRDDEGIGSINLTSNSNGKLKLEFGVDYAVVDSPEGFIANFGKILVDWEDERLVSMSGNIGLDLDSSSLQIVMEDSTALDTKARLSVLWDPEEMSWGGQLDQLLFRVGTEKFVDLSGHLLWGEDDSSIQMAMVDTGYMDFETNLETNWYSEASSWGFAIDDALVKGGSRTFFHCSGEFNLDDAIDVGMMDFQTAPESEVKMIMETHLVWYDAEEALMMTVDRMLLGWQDTIYFDAGVTTQQSPPNDPTLPPTLAPTPPTEENHVFSFKGITIRLEGAIELTEELIDAFEAAMEKFYEAVYEPAVARRRLQDGAVTNFETKVTATGQNLDALGNTITYDQTITFTTNRPNVNADVALVLLTGPLISEEAQEDFVEVLLEEDQAFSSVSSVSTPDVPQGNENKDVPNPTLAPSGTKNKDEDNSNNNMLFIIIAAVGGALLCCCCGGLYYAQSKGLLSSGGNSISGNEPFAKDENGPEAARGLYDPPEGHPESSFHDESIGRAQSKGDENDGRSSSQDEEGESSSGEEYEGSSSDNDEEEGSSDDDDAFDV